MRGSRRPLYLFLAATLLVKLVVAVQLGGHPLLQPAGELDTAFYVAAGRQVASGDVLLGSEAYFASPLYIYFLGAIFALTGGSLSAARIVQAGLGTLAVALVFAMTHRWFGSRAAWAAAVLAAATGILTFYEITILQAALDTVLTAAGLFLLTRALQDGRWRDFFATGVVFGLHALNRPNVIVYAAVLILALAAMGIARNRRNDGPGYWPILTLTAGLLTALAPVGVRNYLATGELVMISSHGGLNFYIGNNPQADGTYHHVEGITPSIAGQARDARVVAESARGRRLNDAEVSGHFYDRSLAWIAANPVRALRLFILKLAYVFTATDLTLNYSYTYYSRDEPTLLRVLAIGPWLLVPIGLVGLAAPVVARGLPSIHAARGWRYALWAAFVPVYALSVAAFFVSGRYRLPLLVPLAVGGGAAISVLHDVWRMRRTSALVSLLAALAISGVGANWRWGLDDGRSLERTEMILFFVDHRRDAEAARLLARTESSHPDPGLMLGRVGSAYLERGDATQALPLLERALAAGDARPELRLSLGQALLDGGRANEALPHLEAARMAGVRPALATYDLARAQAAAGDRPRALATLRELPAAASLDTASLVAAARLALELRDPALAETWLTLASRHEPQSAAIQEPLGLAYAMQGRRDEGIAALERGVSLDPSSASARLNLAVLYAEAGHVDQARQQAIEALRLRSDYPQAQQFLRALPR